MVIREITEEEYSLLRDFLYEAIFIPEGVEPPAREIIEQPELKLYYEDFGKGQADNCIVAEDDGRVIGAVWTRIMNDYGHVDDDTPSFAISLYKEYRGHGIGTRMMKAMLELLRTQGYKKASLAVQKANYAVRMYEKVGFKTIGENDEEYIMVCEMGDFKMTLETKRLILRRWEDSDAEDLYKYASDPDVGPIAGWPAHQGIEESRDVIRNVFNGKEAYAICLKEDGKTIGAIELKLNGHTDMTDRDDECELGYWLGKPFWGQGIMPEAVREMLHHAFEDIGMQKVWCGYYEGNTKSKRVQEKVGFKYQWTTEDVDVPLMHEKRTGHVNLMTKEDWEAMQ